MTREAGRAHGSVIAANRPSSVSCPAGHQRHRAVSSVVLGQRPSTGARAPARAGDSCPARCRQQAGADQRHPAADGDGPRVVPVGEPPRHRRRQEHGGDVQPDDEPCRAEPVAVVAHVDRRHRHDSHHHELRHDHDRRAEAQGGPVERDRAVRARRSLGSQGPRGEQRVGAQPDGEQRPRRRRRRWRPGRTARPGAAARPPPPRHRSDRRGSARRPHRPTSRAAPSTAPGRGAPEQRGRLRRSGPAGWSRCRRRRRAGRAGAAPCSAAPPRPRRCRRRPPRRRSRRPAPAVVRPAATARRRRRRPRRCRR